MEPIRQGSDTDDDEVRSKNVELFRAIDEGELPTVIAILESGVKTDIIDKNNKDNNPLHSAVEKGATEMVAELLNPKWKTNVNLTNSQDRTPLKIARQRGNQEIIKLLTHRVEVKSKTKHEETALVESAQDLNETGNQNKVTLFFQKTKGAAGIEGQLCEINLAMLLLLRGKSDARFTEFYLGSNVEKADKFDDIVFKCKNKEGKSKTIFLQSKHKTSDPVINRSGDKPIKSIPLKDLLSNSESGEFALKKYFISYRKIKQHFLNNENSDDPVFSGNFEECEFVLYTNAPFEHGNNSCIKEIEMDDNDLFKTKDSQGKIFQFPTDSNKKKIFELVKDSSDCRRLAKALAVAFFSNKGLDILKDVCKTYHRALKEKVIEKTQNSNGRLREDFLSGADNNNFRNVFFDEAEKAFNPSSDKIMPKLQGKELKLSNKFWDKNASGFSDLPDDDPICENDIKDFLAKFKLYSSQSNEQALESAIKKTAGEFYKIQRQDISQVFASVQIEVKNWWQHNNFYLMNDNKFFEDALRVSVEFDVIGPVASFTGREQALKDLHRMLQEGWAVSISQITAVTGLGGIGKSELARKYLKEHKDDYDNNAIWINAESLSTIIHSFQTLAKDTLNMNIIDENNKEKDIIVLAKEVYNFFAKMNRKSIFVFDNAEKKGPEDEYVDKLLPSGLNKPYVIITSRHQDWDGINNLPLGLFTQEEAAAFIKNALEEKKIEFQDNELQELIKELDCLPLALRQAVAYISVENEKSKKWSNKQFTISNYMDEFHKNAIPLLSSGKIRNHTETVMTTWKTSIKKIQLESELALEILQVIAYLAPDQIPVEEIFATVKCDLSEIRSAAELLEQYSIIGINGGKVNIHRLVQKVTRLEMEEMKQNEQTLVNIYSLLKACYPYRSEIMNDHFKQRMLLPHFEVFLSHIQQFLQTKKPEDRTAIEKNYLIDLFEWMADGYRQNPERRKELYERALTIYENCYEPDHLEVARTLTNLGNAYGALGDAMKQKELLERALLILIFENNCGPQHFSVAITLDNLGNAYGDLGDEKKKRELLECALPIIEKYYGSDHFQVAITLENLGNAHGALGDEKKKRELLERALPITEKYYGSDHFQVAITLANLGNAYGALGYALKKKELLERALTIQENYYGPDHFEVGKTLTNLGNAYGALGDTLKQIELLELALTINVNYYGRNHFEVGKTLANLGNAYGALGDVPKSKNLLEHALRILENYYGSDHFLVAITLENLGNAYGDLGYALEQKQLLERALTIKESYYGLDHFQVASTLTNLGNAYGALGDAQKQKELLERALLIKESYYGRDHISVAITLGNLGNAYGALGDAPKQKELLERTLTINENYYGPDHFQVAITLTNLGNAYGALGDALKQKELLERALPILENHYGRDNFLVAITLENLGNAYGASGDAPKQKDLLERALTIKESYYGLDHFQVACTLTNLGNAYGDLGEALKQKDLLERALTINEKYYGLDHFQVAITLGYLGKAYGALGDALKQKQLLERALIINEKYYGPDHFQVAITLGNLGNAYGALGDALKQKELLERALPILENHYGRDNFQVAITLGYLGNAYGALGDAPKQKDLLERALTIKESYYGPDHFQVAITLTNLGNAYGALGDAQEKKKLLERALPILEGALIIKESYYGLDHFQVAITLGYLGNAYGALGDALKQKELLERALPINEKYYGPDHFQVARTLASLGDAHYALGDAQKSKQLLERALNIQENYYGPDHFEVALTRALLRKTLGYT